MQAPRPPLVVVVDRADNGVKIAVHGDIDFRDYERFVQEVTAQIPPSASATVLTLDLGEVTYCDTAGLAALVQIRRSCDASGWTFGLDRGRAFGATAA